MAQSSTPPAAPSPEQKPDEKTPEQRLAEQREADRRAAEQRASEQRVAGPHTAAGTADQARPATPRATVTPPAATVVMQGGRELRSVEHVSTLVGDVDDDPEPSQSDLDDMVTLAHGESID